VLAAGGGASLQELKMMVMVEGDAGRRGVHLVGSHGSDD